MADRSVEAAPPRRAAPMGGPRRTRVVIRKVGPLSILRWSMFFYFCVFLIFFFAMFIIFGVLASTGVLKSVGNFLVGSGLSSCPQNDAHTATCTFTFDSGWIFSRVFLIGVVLVCVWSIINVLVSLLYNLVSDVIGGVELTLLEKR